MGRKWVAKVTVLVLAVLLASATVGSLSALAAEAPSTRGFPSDAEISRLLQERLRHTGVGIVVGLIGPEGRRIVAAGASGSPDGRLDGQTIFQIGSLTKTFTSLLLADMVERGEVALDDPLQKYLPPDVQLIVRGRPITLLDVVTHRSGLPSMPDNLRVDAKPDPIAGYTSTQLDDFLRHFQPTRAPGEKYEYSNLAVSVLGRALARRAGTDFETLLKQRVLRPLGLMSTGIRPERAWGSRMATGHGPYGVPVETPEMVVMPASGSLRSTADDLLQFLAAYLQYASTPLDAAMRRQLSTRSPMEKRSALAWGAQVIDGREIYSHDGGKAGFRSAAVFDLQSRTGVVVLMNSRTDDRPIPLAMHLLAGAALPPPPESRSPKPVVRLRGRELDRFAGTYRSPEGTVYRVARNRNRLFVDYGRGNILEFKATGQRDFFYVAGNDDLTFEIDGRNRVTGLRIYADGRTAGTSELAARL